MGFLGGVGYKHGVVSLQLMRQGGREREKDRCMLCRNSTRCI